MRKLLVLFAVLAFGFLLASCKEKVDPATENLQSAYDSLNALIADPSNITGGFEVPTTLVGGVSATWTSSNPGVVTVGAANNGFAVITVNRPAFGQPNVNVTLSVVLSIPSELDDTKTLTKDWSVVLTIVANTVEEINIENIADVLALTDPEYDGKYQVSLQNLTVFAKGQDASFAYDGTGIIQIYGGTQENLVQGKVYTVDATIDWYFGIWELTKWTAVEQTTATPQVPTKEIVESVNTKIDALIAADQHKYSGQTASAGNMEAIFATVTGKVYMVPGDTGNYNTYIVDTTYNTAQDWVPGSAEAPARGFMVYYNTQDFATLRLYNGITVTIDVMIYTYRSNNQAFAIYYVGGPEGIEATLTDAQKLEIDANAINVPTIFEETTTFDFATTGTNGSTIAWVSSNNDVINVATGAITAPSAGGVQVELTATITFGSLDPVVKKFLVTVGEFEITNIADLYNTTNFPAGTTVRVQGILTGGHSSFYFIQDATGGVGLYPASAPSELRVNMAALTFGVKVDIIGEVNNSARGYLEIGINKVENVKVIDSVPALPAAVAIDAVSPFTLTGLADYRSERVDLTGVIITQLSVSTYETYSFTFVNPVTGISILGNFDNRSNQFTAAKTALAALKVGDIVDIKGAVLGATSGNPRLEFHYPGQIVASAVTYTDQQLADGAKAMLKNLPEANAEITGDLVLPTTGMFGATIAWTSSNTAIITVDGKVTRPAAGQPDANVTLGYTVTVGTASTVEATIAVTVLAIPAEPVTTATDLFISEYIEGGGFNKAIEIFNGTGAAVDLSIYKVQLFSNGAATASQTVTLSGTLAHGDVYVIYHADAVQAIKDAGDLANSNVTNFNGDDAFALLKNDVIIDLIGVVGERPSNPASWAVGTGSTLDYTLVRKAGVYQPSATFDPTQWDVHPKDTTTFIGSHTFTPGA